MSDKTVDEIMGLVDRFRNGEVSDRLIREAITAIAAERDTCRVLLRQAQEDFGAALNAAEKERDALKAQLKESQEFVKTLRDDVRRLNSEDVRF